MRFTYRWSLLLLILCVAPQPALPGHQTTVPVVTPQTIALKAEAAKGPAQVDLFLRNWEAESKKWTSLHVVFEQTNRSNTWGDQVFQGQAYLKSPNQACIDLKRAIPGPGAKPKTSMNAQGQTVIAFDPKPFRRLVWNNADHFQYEFDERAVYVYSLARLATWKFLSMDHPLKPMTEIPYVTQINADRLRERFNVRFVPQTDPQVTLVELKARVPSPLMPFARALIWLDKRTFLPTRATLFSMGNRDQTDFRLTRVDVNPTIDAQYFHPETNISGWKVFGEKTTVAIQE